MPNCIGSVGGKRFDIQIPPNSYALRQKKYKRMVLMAACDAKYRFTLVNIGAFGSETDGGVYTNSSFGQQILNGTLEFPEPQKLPGTTVKFPFYFVGDEAFPLKSHLMRPYPVRYLNRRKQIYNYRLSRASRVIENAFGILLSQWKVLGKTFLTRPEFVDRVVLATVCLHNFLIRQEELVEEGDRKYCHKDMIDFENASGQVRTGDWRMDKEAVRRIGRFFVGNRIGTKVLGLRDTFAEYVSGKGAVAWQEEQLDREN